MSRRLTAAMGQAAQAAGSPLPPRRLVPSPRPLSPGSAIPGRRPCGQHIGDSIQCTRRVLTGRPVQRGLPLLSENGLLNTCPDSGSGTLPGSGCGLTVSGRATRTCPASPARSRVNGVVLGSSRPAGFVISRLSPPSRPSPPATPARGSCRVPGNPPERSRGHPCDRSAAPPARPYPQISGEGARHRLYSG